MFDVSVEDQFGNDEKMFIPLTIDNMEIDNSNYFFSGKKFVMIFASLMPYLIIFFFLNSIPNIKVFLIYTLMYLVLWSYYLRYSVFEESKQKEAMKELEENKYSELSFFWELDKIGSGKRDNGMLYIQPDGITIKRGYIIELDGGSLIGLPDTAYRDYITTLQEMYRSFYRMGFDIHEYNIRKRPELSSVLGDYAKRLQDLDNDAYRKLMQLNIETNYLYTNSESQRYVKYLVVINKRVDNLMNFKTIVDDILTKTIRANTIFAEPKIYNKIEVDTFLANYYGQDRINSAGIHKADGYRDFNEYCELINVYNASGSVVPYDIIGSVGEIVEKEVGISVDDLLKQDSRETRNFEERVKRSLDSKLAELRNLRRSETITWQEYQDRVAEVERSHKLDVVTEEDLLPVAEQRKLAKQREREETRDRKREEKQRQKEIAEKEKAKWYTQEDTGNVLERDKVEALDLTNDADYTGLEFEVFDDDIDLDDLL